jgi:glutamyl-Q tRNA(Asp) synthetase
MTSPPVFRFAPSPTGLLHIGHAFSALYAFKAAQAAGGRFLLRIEDIDSTRCRPEYAVQILDDLSWLGLEWQQPVRYQSEHMSDYARALEKLDALGLTYPCRASRGEIKAQVERTTGLNEAARDPDGALLYPGLYRHGDSENTAKMRVPGRPVNIRLKMDEAIKLTGDNLTFQENGAGPKGENGEVRCNPRAWGDIVIARKDTPTSYHLSVVVDDALQGISEVTRGEDVFYATSIHRLLQTLLELPQPLYNHHRLIRDESGRRLSKSAADKSIKALRQEGLSLNHLLHIINSADI